MNVPPGIQTISLAGGFLLITKSPAHDAKSVFRTETDYPNHQDCKTRKINRLERLLGGLRHVDFSWRDGFVYDDFGRLERRFLLNLFVRFD